MKSIKECCKITGKTAYWLRNHVCGWCDQTALNSVRFGCGAMWEQCNPMDKFNNEPKKESK